MGLKLFIYAIFLTGVLTFILYRYHQAQPPDAAQIARCNELASAMPESTPEEINRSIHAFHECLEN